MIQAKDAQKYASKNAREFAIDFIDQSITLQMTEANKEGTVDIRYSDEGARDLTRIMAQFPRMFAELLDEYRMFGWHIETISITDKTDSKAYHTLRLKLDPSEA